MNHRIFEEEKYSFNFMPLLDAIFLLIIFFILTVTLEKDEMLLPLELPVAEHPELSKLESAIIVEVDINGAFYYETKLLSLEQLEETLREVRLKYNKDILLIRSEKGADVQRLLQLTELARRLGIEKVSLAVEACC